VTREWLSPRKAQIDARSPDVLEEVAEVALSGDIADLTLRDMDREGLWMI
jgi:hypothetical protein